jgi:hypothetical protein
MFEKFTDRAGRVVVRVQEEARMLGHDYIGTEHLLLGLIHEGEGVAVRALESVGISPEAVRQQVQEIIGQGQQAPSGDIPFTPRAKKVLELSLREALRDRDQISTGHILLGLIREGDGVAAQVLVKLGADLNRIRQEVFHLTHGGQGKEPSSAGARPRGSATDHLAHRINRIESRVSAFEFRIDAIESRLSALEFRVGTGPDVRGLDTEIAQARLAEEAAIGEQDFEAVTSLRDKQQQLIDEKASRQREWEAARPDPKSLAEKVGQLSDEIEQLRGLLRQQGTEAEEGTV